MVPCACAQRRRESRYGFWKDGMHYSGINDRFVFITGASSGIGRACALALDGAGLQVLAGVRRQADAEALRREASPRLGTVFVDVADGTSVGDAAAEVAGLAGGRLFGLVNNAGMAFGGPLEGSSADDIRRLLEVNIGGVLAVTKAVLPLLRAGGGRVVNMGSTSGILALPCLSAYAASKFALRGLSDALRLELGPVGVSVTLLEIGNVATPIWDKGIAIAEAGMAAAGPEMARLYGPLADFSRQVALKAPRIPAEAVARTVQKALLAERPRASYTVGMDARLFKLLACLPLPLRVWLLSKCLPRYGSP